MIIKKDFSAGPELVLISSHYRSVSTKMPLVVSRWLVYLWLAVYADCFQRHLRLDANYQVWWRIQAKEIVFQVEVATRGWVAFGISPNGGMAGSDLITGSIDNGKVTFHDRHAKGRFLPDIDRQQDWELLWHRLNDTHTQLGFKRRLVTCDSQDLPITDETTRLIFAYSSEEAIGYHGPKNRGSQSVYLRDTGNRQLDENPGDLYHWDVVIPNVKVPEDRDTEYYCKFFTVPDLDRKHHMIKFQAIVQPGSEKLVHHMILYECTGVDQEKFARYLDEEYTECYTEDNLPKFPFCLTMTYGWAVGGGDFVFPNVTGLPLNIPEVKWFLLEIHYDNPGLLKGVVDNSGFRITHTPKLRKYDAAILGVGNLWYPCMFVPPQQDNFIVAGHGHPSCLSQRIPPEGVKVMAALLHSHVIGKKIILRHFRGQQELAPLARDLKYDFNYQEFRIFPEERVLLPNDHLILECIYDSSRRTKPTFGGLSTREEMCLAFLAYYPRLSISFVTSCPSPFRVVKKLGVKEMSDDDRFVVSPLTGKNESYFDFLNSYRWDNSSADTVQRAMRYSPQLNVCSDRGGKGILSFALSRYPSLKKTYQERNECDKSSF